MFQDCLVRIRQSARFCIAAMSRLLNLLWHHSTKLTITIRLLLLYNHAVILLWAPNSRAYRVPIRFGTDSTINPMVNSSYVSVAEPVVAVIAPSDQSRTHHSFTIVIESCCDTLVGAN